MRDGSMTKTFLNTDPSAEKTSLQNRSEVKSSHTHFTSEKKGSEVFSPSEVYEGWEYDSLQKRREVKSFLPQLKFESVCE